MLGKSERGIGDYISQTVQSPEIINSIVARVSTGTNLFPNDVRKSYGSGSIKIFFLDEGMVKGYSYILKVSTSSSYVNTENFRFYENTGSGEADAFSRSTNKVEGYQTFEFLFKNVEYPSTEVIMTMPSGSQNLKVESFHRFEPDLAQVQSEVTQLSDSYAVTIKNPNQIMAELNLTSKGVRLKGEQIMLDGDVDVRGDFRVTGNMIAGSISATKVSGGDLNFTNIRAVNFDFDGASGKNVDLSGRIDAHSGMIGKWNFNDYLYARTTDINTGKKAYTTLKPDGSVAISAGSENHGFTDGAPFQVFHNGKLRVRADTELGDVTVRGGMTVSTAGGITSRNLNGHITDGYESGKETIRTSYKMDGQLGGNYIYYGGYVYINFRDGFPYSP